MLIEYRTMLCRVCLVMDVKMYDLKDYKYSKMFQNITGIPVCDETESTIHRVCWECAARLTGASAFREKALLSDALLKSLVHINKREIEQLKQYYSQLKPTLTIQTVFTSTDTECEDTKHENELYSAERKNSLEDEEETDLNEPLTSTDIEYEDTKHENELYSAERKNSLEDDEKTDLNKPLTSTDIEYEDTKHENELYSAERKNSLEDEEETDLNEPLIEIPVKTEIEPDPIAEYIQIKNEKSETFSELTNIDDSFTATNEDDDCEVKNTEEKMDIHESNEIIEINNALVEDKIDIVEGSAEKLDLVENKAEMAIEPNDDSDIVLAEDNVEENPTLDDIDAFSSEENTQSLAELASVKKAKKNKRRKVGASNKRPNKLNDAEKQKIIALKEKGMSMSEIAEETGKTLSCITTWWQRYSQEANIQEDSTAEKGTEEKLTEELSEFLLCPTVVDVCPASVKRKLLEGLEKEDKGQKIRNHTGMPISLRKAIIRLKNAGLTSTRVSLLLGINKNSVAKWWTRWCNEKDLTERKRGGRRKKTTPEQDQLILDTVTNSPNISTASLATEFGVSPEVDEHLKERIITMKQNGFGVTDMAREFKVPRTTIYQWWRRWCEENNIERSNKDANDNTQEGSSLTKDAKNEKTEKPSKKLSRKNTIESNVEKTKKTRNKVSRKKAQANVEKIDKTIKKISTRKLAKRKKKPDEKISTRKLAKRKKKPDADPES